MKYRIHYSDSAGDIDYTKTIDYDGPVEALLKDQCEENEDRFHRLQQGLKEKIPGYNPLNGPVYRYEINRNEARIYTVLDNIMVLIITVTPL